MVELELTSAQRTVVQAVVMEVVKHLNIGMVVPPIVTVMVTRAGLFPTRSHPSMIAGVDY